MLVVTERPPSITELMIAEAQKAQQKWEAEARKARKAQKELAKREAEIAKLNAALIELAAKAEK